MKNENFTQIVDLRRRSNYEDLRGKYTQFLESIHDVVRKGEVLRLSTPLSAFWAITRKCNLRCSHCYASSFLEKESKELEITAAFQIIDTLKNMNIGEIVLEGGEPLCYPNFCELVEYVKLKDIPITLITNGTMFSEKIIECINNKFDAYDAIQISMDGTKETCDLIRGKGTYDKVIGTISKLRCQIIINCVITNETIHTIENMCSILNKYENVRTVHFSPLMKMGKGIVHKEAEIHYAIDVLKGLKRKYGDWISGTTVPDAELFKLEKVPFIDMKNIIFGCCAGRSKIFINPEGEVFPCDFCQQESHINILNQNFYDEWNHHWNVQAKTAQIVSQKMKQTGKLLKFCPNMEVV